MRAAWHAVLEELPAPGKGMLWGPGHGSAGLPWHWMRLPSPAAFEGLIFPLCRDALSIHPAGIPPRSVAPVPQGAWAARALLMWMGTKSSLLLLLSRERCQRCLLGAPSVFVPSYRLGAAPWCCQGHREQGCSQSLSPLPRPFLQAPTFCP